MKISKIENIHYNKPIPVYDVYNAGPYHNFVFVSNEKKSIAHNCDEINFSQAGIRDVTKAKERMTELYTTIADRIKGTFRMDGRIYGKLFAVSSKRSDSDFMEVYIQKQKSAGADKYMYIDDKPQWEVLPPSTFSSQKFYIAVGDRHHKGFVVSEDNPSEESLLELKNQGYTLLTPPLDMKPEFSADFDIALRDLAGIAVPGALSFITQESLDACIGNRSNPFLNDILEIGVKDNYSIEEFFHKEFIDSDVYTSPMFIHLDLSLNTDMTGISGVCISGRRDVSLDGGQVVSVPTFKHIFSLSLRAPRGDKIPYTKILNFIMWLRAQKFNIEKITRDQFQSEYLGQLLESNGFEVKKISLDRTPDGYQALRSVILEQRIDMLDVKLLQDELIHLQRDSISQKVDHPVGGCFTGDTQVLLADGRICTIASLVENNSLLDNYTYTINEETGNTEIKLIKSAFRTKVVSHLLQITLSDKSIIRCTEDHRFMLPDLTFEPIENIPIGSELKTYDGRILKLIHKQQQAVNEIVYDLEINENHNYTLACGAIVHNSKDMADSFAGAVWEAICSNPEVKLPISKTASLVSSLNNSRYKSNPLPSVFRAQNMYRKF